MKIQYLLPYWGLEHLSPSAYLERAVADGFNGIEINVPLSAAFEGKLRAGVDKLQARPEGFVFAAQCVPEAPGHPMDLHLGRYRRRLESLAALEPDFINAHTGRDYLSFDENCRLIEVALGVSARTGVRILHETHRGRFSFHATQLLAYLDRFPELELTADFSHFCTVSESMLEGQEEALERIIRQASHIHARVGYEHGPQVPDPAALEWAGHLQTFTGWWDRIRQAHEERGAEALTVTPEAGPVPYQPAAPFTRRPLANQQSVNLWMKDWLEEAWADAPVSPMYFHG